MEIRIIKLIQTAVRNGKGMITIIGDTYTGKTYIANKIIKKMKLQVIPYDFDTVPKNAGKSNPSKAFGKHEGPKIGDFFGPKKIVRKNKHEILFCDALETYSSSVLGFLKKIAQDIPVLVTCDTSIVIPNIKIIDRVWWNGKKRTPEGWDGDTILHTPRNLFASLTQRRTRTEIAINNFGSDSFLLSQYYHDEFPTYKKADLNTIVRNTNALSTFDVFRTHEWESNGLLSTTSVNHEIFVRDIRLQHRNPCLTPKGWFPKTLAKSGKITRNISEIAGIETALPNIRDKISAFNFKIGRSFAYKKQASHILGKCTNEQQVEAFSRALELTGNKGLTKTEIKKYLVYSI